MEEDIEDKFYMQVINKARAKLLDLADQEIKANLKGKLVKINSNLPKIVNYCKENNFFIKLEQNFCVSRVEYTEKDLKNVKINKILKTHHKKRSTFGNSSNKFITRIKIPCTQTKTNEKEYSNQNSKKNNVQFNIPTNTNLIRKSTFTQENFFLNGACGGSGPGSGAVLNVGIESPTIKRLKCLKKLGISHFKDNNYNGEKIISRHNRGAYLDDIVIFELLKESFYYIKNLPISQLKNREERVIENLVEKTLIYKDNIDARSANKKMKILKRKSEDLFLRKKNGSNTFRQHNNLSPLNPKRNSKLGPLFLNDIKTNNNNFEFKLKLEKLIFDNEPGLLTEKIHNASDLDFDFDFSIADNDDNDNLEDDLKLVNYDFVDNLEIDRYRKSSINIINLNNGDDSVGYDDNRTIS